MGVLSPCPTTLMPHLLSAGCPTPSEGPCAPKHGVSTQVTLAGVVRAEHPPDKAWHQRAAHKKGVQAHSWAPQPPLLLHTSALATSQTAPLSWEPPNSPPAPILSMLWDKGRKGQPSHPRWDTPGHAGQVTHALDSQVCGQQWNQTPEHIPTSSHSTAPAPLRMAV